MNQVEYYRINSGNTDELHPITSLRWKHSDYKTLQPSKSFVKLKPSENWTRRGTFPATIWMSNDVLMRVKWMWICRLGEAWSTFSLPHGRAERHSLFIYTSCKTAEQSRIRLQRDVFRLSKLSFPVRCWGTYEVYNQHSYISLTEDVVVVVSDERVEWCKPVIWVKASVRPSDQSEGETSATGNRMDIRKVRKVWDWGSFPLGVDDGFLGGRKESSRLLS